MWARGNSAGERCGQSREERKEVEGVTEGRGGGKDWEGREGKVGEEEGMEDWAMQGEGDEERSRVKRKRGAERKTERGR